MNKPSKPSKSPVTKVDLKPGDFPIGSASSRAAARVLLNDKQEAEKWEANRPPDVRIVFGIPRPQQRMHTAVHRSRDREGRITEIILPAQLYHGESLGCCEVQTDLSVDEVIRRLRELRRREALAAQAIEVPQRQPNR